MSDDTLRVRIGVMGCGERISAVIANVREQAPGVTITALFDPSAASIARFKSLQNIPDADVCATAEALAAREDVDWVFIGSWNSFHADQAIAALRHGKHVFCEKPLALSLDDALRMHEAWRAAGTTFALGLVLRYSPLYRLARQFIDEGRIGTLLSFEFNETLTFNHGGFIHGDWRRRRRNAGSHLLEKCCHDIDLALWLAGALPARVASFGGNTFFVPANQPMQEKIGLSPTGATAFQSWRAGENAVNPFTDDKDIVDHQVAILEFSHGVRATFHTHCMAALPERRFYLLGSEGAMRFDAYTGQLEHARVGWNEKVSTHSPISGDGHAGADKPMAKELVAAMAGRLPPAAGIAEGMKSLVTAEGIDRAMDEGRVVDLRETWESIAKATKRIE